MSIIDDAAPLASFTRSLIDNQADEDERANCFNRVELPVSETRRQDWTGSFFNYFSSFFQSPLLPTGRKNLIDRSIDRSVDRNVRSERVQKGKSGRAGFGPRGEERRQKWNKKEATNRAKCLARIRGSRSQPLSAGTQWESFYWRLLRRSWGAD